MAALREWGQRHATVKNKDQQETRENDRGRGGDYDKELRSPPGRWEQRRTTEARKILGREQGGEALIKTHFD